MNDIIHITHYDSPLGNITIASDGKALTGLWFDGQKHFADTIVRMPCKEDPQLPVFADTRRWLDRYFAGERPDFTPLLAPQGTPFRQAVWKILLTIPYGETMSYGEIAQRVVDHDSPTRRHNSRPATRCGHSYGSFPHRSGVPSGCVPGRGFQADAPHGAPPRGQ